MCGWWVPLGWGEKVGLWLNWRGFWGGSCGGGGDGLGTPAKLFSFAGPLWRLLSLQRPSFLLRGQLHSLKAKCPSVSLPSPRVTPGLATPLPPQGECQADAFRVTRLPSGSGGYPWALPPSVGGQRLRVRVSGPKDQWHNPGSEEKRSKWPSALYPCLSSRQSWGTRLLLRPRSNPQSGALCVGLRCFTSEHKMVNLLEES